MIKCKYFDDLGLNPEEYGTNFVADDDKRAPRFAEQRELYGFDERETWALNITFIEWIYSRCMMYLETASELVNLDFYKITCRGIEYTQREAIEKIISLAKEVLLNKWDDDILEYNNSKEICELWTELIPHMWW